MLQLTTLNGNITKALRAKIPDLTIKIYQAEQENTAVTNGINFQLIDWKQIGKHISYYENENLNNSSFETNSVWGVTLRIVTVGIKSSQLALELGHHFNKAPFLQSFQAIGLYYLSKSDIKHAPRQLSTGWEQRHILDIQFNIRVSDVENIDFVDIIEVTHNVEDENGDVVISRTDEIDI